MMFAFGIFIGFMLIISAFFAIVEIACALDGDE